MNRNVDDIAAALRAYTSSHSATEVNRSSCALAKQRWRPVRTHLHAEMVKRRREPTKSSKKGVVDALEALASGDLAAVEALMSRSGEAPVEEEWQQRYKLEAQSYWDQFYREKTVNFFKDRHYLREEFPELMPEEIASEPKKWVDCLEATEQEPPSSPAELSAAMDGRQVLLEVGCAVGNGVIPLLRCNPNLFAFACDLSPVAVQFLREKEEYRCGRCLAFACDITRGLEQPTTEHAPIEVQVPEDSVDFATLLFVLSAIDPSLYRGVIARLKGRLRVGGVIMVRDYGRGDLAQLRFSPSNWLGGDLYVRGDGTLAAFLTVEGLVADFAAEGFDMITCEYRRSELVNRGTGVVMPRIWVQGKFRRRE